MIHEADVERQKAKSRQEHDADDPDAKSVATLQWGIGLAACMAIALSLVLCSAVQAHGMYQGLKNADGDSCCNDVDCKPVPHRFTGTGVEIEYGGVWYPVDYDRIVGTSQDERFHACKMLYDVKPRCFITPGGEV